MGKVGLDRSKKTELDAGQGEVSGVATKPKTRLTKMLEPWWGKLCAGVALLAWVAGVMMLTGLALAQLAKLVMPPGQLENAAVQLVYAALTYAVALAIIVLIPKLILKLKENWADLGVIDWPKWEDILFGICGFVIAIMAAGILTFILQKVLPGVDWAQKQNVGFDKISSKSDMLMAFVALVVLAPIFEELVFRGWLYRKLKKIAPVGVSILLVSLLFAAMHGQWNVGVTVFALSVVTCLIQEFTGTVYGGIFLHMLKNAIAFYALFMTNAFFGF